jgi:CRP-like cAMP-binding protein
MLGSVGALRRDGAEALIRRFKDLGVDREDELQALLTLIKAKRRVERGEDIVRVGSSLSCLTVLLTGLACRYRMIENGRRQIFTFQYPGDLCDFDRYILPEGEDAVAALTNCSVGIIAHEDIGKVTAKHPRLRLALWRAAMIEAGIFRERLLNVSQRPALPRIANLLAEQMVRLEAIGVSGAVIPMTQVDLADAASLSPVHMNRTVQDLRELGVLSKSTHAIEVVHRERLMDLGKFDGRYLNASFGLQRHARSIAIEMSDPIGF